MVFHGQESQTANKRKNWAMGVYHQVGLSILRLDGCIYGPIEGIEFHRSGLCGTINLACWCSFINANYAISWFHLYAILLIMEAK